MRKRSMMFIIIVMLFLFSSTGICTPTPDEELSSPPEASQLDEEAFVKALNDNIGPKAAYMDWYDSANKEIQSAAGGFDGLIQANQDNILSAIIAQYLELMYKDAALCGAKQENRNTLINLSKTYTEMKRQVIMNYPEGYSKEVMEILKDARDYYYKTKTRGAGFSPICKRKIRSVR